MKGETCWSCRYHHRRPGDDVWVECRAHPPTVTLISRSARPLVRAEEGCGEHKPRQLGE